MATKQTKVWIENLTPHQTNFTSSVGNFSLAPYGTEQPDRSSVVQVNEDLADEPFVQRAIQRGKLKILTKAEATVRLTELVTPPSDDDELMEYMSLGADHKTDLFKKDLEEDAFPTGPGWKMEEILGGKKTAAIAILKSGPKKQSASNAVEKGGHKEDFDLPDDDLSTVLASRGRSSDE